MTQQESLTELYRAAEHKREIETEIAIADETHMDLVRLGKEYRETLTAEAADVEKLEKPSLVNAWFNITGKMDEKREKEVSEAAEAQARYEAVLAEIKAVSERLAALKRELAALDCSRLDADMLRKEMVASLVASNAESAPQAELLLERMNQAQADADDLTAVIGAGKAAVSTAAELLEELRKSQRLAHDPGSGSHTRSLIGKAAIAHIKNQDYLRAGQEKFDRLMGQLALYRTPLCTLPRFGELKTVENILCGRTWGGTEPIDSSVAEIEKLMEAIDTSSVKLERIKQNRLDAYKRFHQELNLLLLSDL